MNHFSSSRFPQKCLLWDQQVFSRVLEWAERVRGVSHSIMQLLPSSYHNLISHPRWCTWPSFARHCLPPELPSCSRQRARTRLITTTTMLLIYLAVYGGTFPPSLCSSARLRVAADYTPWLCCCYCCAWSLYACGSLNPLRAVFIRLNFVSRQAKLAAGSRKDYLGTRAVFQTREISFASSCRLLRIAWSY